MEKKTKNAAAGARKFGFLDKLSYAAGDFGCNMSFALKGTVNTFWLVYMGLDSALFSALLLAVQIWDGINDPIIGALIDRDTRQYRIGKFKAYILTGAFGLLVSGALCFIPVPNAPTLVKSIIFVVGYIIWDAFYTVANVPYGSMLSLISSDSGERAQLSAWRGIGSAVGNALPMIILPFLIWRNVYDENGNPLINAETGKPVQELLGERLFYIALIMGVIGFLSFLFMLKNSVIRSSDGGRVDSGSGRTSVFGSILNFFGNRAAMGATIAAMGMFLGTNASSTATAIMFSIYFGRGELSGIAGMAGVIPLFILVPFVKGAVLKWGKKECAAIGSFISLIGGAVMLVFPIVPREYAMAVYIFALFICGMGSGIYQSVSWALMSDAIDLGEWKYGVREEGMVYSLHSFFRKFAQGLGPAAVILIMGFLGYDSKIPVGAQSYQTALNMCRLVASLWFISALFMFVGTAFVYNLNKKMLGKIHEELRERHSRE